MEGIIGEVVTRVGGDVCREGSVVVSGRDGVSACRHVLCAEERTGLGARRSLTGKSKVLESTVLLPSADTTWGERP